ncbi:hypothetical protein [Streptomyces coelicoflavus]|uniref:hypothetical protein n=1 Tax=Streptomyces coelicoflavus TaxID=285562 RepID=UPI003634AA5E
MNRPLLFLDVDGPLNPYAAQPERRPEGCTTLRVPRSGVHENDGGSLSSRRRPLRVWLNPEHGRTLLGLGFELCWATTWMDFANGRPFAWVDDEQSELDQTYVTAHHQGPGLLHHVNPRIGLRQTDFHTLAAWYDSVAHA